MVDDLEGRTALVTGGSRGIGAAICRALAEAGAAVAINCREQMGQAEKLAGEIGKRGGRAIVVAADVSQREAVAAMVERVTTGLGPVDILVNNAGIAITRGVDDLTEEDFDRTILVNLKSAFLCTQAVLPSMRARNGAASSTSPRARRAAPAQSGHTTMHPRPAWRASPAAVRRALGEGRHHRQCGGTVADRDRHDERPAAVASAASRSAASARRRRSRRP